MTENNLTPAPKNNAKSIKTFFEQDGGRKVTMDELKALSSEERDELGSLAQAELDRKAQ